MADITYDPASDGGVDVLELLVASMFDQLSEPVLIDFAGRRISALEDLEDVKVVELIPESLQSSVEDVLGHRETAGWDHHEHLLNATKEIDTKGALMRGTTVVNIWVLDKVDLSLHRYCTSTVFAPSAPAAATDTSADNTCILQPVHRIIDTTLLLCTRCAQMVSQDIMQKGSEKLIKFNCSGKQVLDIGLGVPLEDSASVFSDHELKAAPIQAFLRHSLIDQAITDQKLFLHQSDKLGMGSDEQQGMHRLIQRLKSGEQQIRVYEDETQQRAARKVIDYGKIKQYAEEHKKQHPDQEEISFIFALMRWFKGGFFRWCNEPPCTNASCKANCTNETLPDGSPRPNQRLEATGQSDPNDEEQKGWASRVELYKCRHCQTVVRFPRYNNPMTLLETRKGRCGEWANAFCLICRALSLDARWVLDFTDHVWVEVWIPSLQRYVHVDPCERAFDAPLMYETGWKKQLSYVFSFSRHGLADVTPRYTRRLSDILERRGPPSERAVQDYVRIIDRKLEESFKNQLATKRAAQHQSGGSIHRSISSSSLHTDALDVGYEAFEKLSCEEISEATLMRRKRKLVRELSALSLLTTHEWKLEELQGRISGSREWREARGELGSSATKQGDEKEQEKYASRETTNRTIDQYSPAYMLPCCYSSSSPSSPISNRFIRTIDISCEDDCSASYKINVSSISDELNGEMYSMWLGGQLHPDTTTFTQAACLLPSTPPAAVPDPKGKFRQLFSSIFARCKSEGMENAAATAHALKQAQVEMTTPTRPKLVGIKIYSGKNYVNGVECVYSCSHEGLNSPKERSYGDHDNPQESLISLANIQSKIIKIAIKYGNIIDGLSLITEDGQEFNYGGNGGEFRECLSIPPGYELTGFYGGVGGHLHNLGVVLDKIE